MSEYISSKSVSYRKPIWIYSNDPRARSEYTLEKYRAKIGNEVLVREKDIYDYPLQEYVEE